MEDQSGVAAQCKTRISSAVVPAPRRAIKPGHRTTGVCLGGCPTGVHDGECLGHLLVKASGIAVAAEHYLPRDCVRQEATIFGEQAEQKLGQGAGRAGAGRCLAGECRLQSGWNDLPPKGYTGMLALKLHEDRTPIPPGPGVRIARGQ